MDGVESALTDAFPGGRWRIWTSDLFRVKEGPHRALTCIVAASPRFGPAQDSVW